MASSFLRVSLLVTSVGLLVTPAGANVIAGPITNPSNGHAYYLLSPQSWSSAQSEAVSLGGNLVTIRNAQENQWLLNTFHPLSTPNAYGLTDYWIGLYDPYRNDGSSHASNFSWISGETSTYRNWAAGEPNNGNGGEYGGLMIGTSGYGLPVGSWNDGTLPYPDLALAEVIPSRPQSNVTRYYRFETNNGLAVSAGQALTTADDSSGFGRNGTVRGTVRVAATNAPNPVPQIGLRNTSAIAGDASVGAGILLRPDSAPILSKSFTLEAFFSIGSTNPTTGDVKRIFQCDGTTSSPLGVYVFNMDGQGGTNDLYCSFDNETFALHYSNLVANQTYHMALTYNGSEADLYINGTLVDSGLYQGFNGSGSAIAGVGNDSRFIGRVFPGQIDELRISDISLDPSHFLNVVPEPNLVGVLGLMSLCTLRRRVWAE
jgi:hypothetical protein